MYNWHKNMNNAFKAYQNSDVIPKKTTASLAPPSITNLQQAVFTMPLIRLRYMAHKNSIVLYFTVLLALPLNASIYRRLGLQASLIKLQARKR